MAIHMQVYMRPIPTGRRTGDQRRHRAQPAVLQLALAAVAHDDRRLAAHALLRQVSAMP